ncbi:hypothetical protein RB195_011847 [Necator americanus]|uniref:GIY-YIG domain-containing protein n=1 Tax=Necator americanus TaxID=51031 RepID=A0ABR1D7H1_NECAM
MISCVQCGDEYIGATARPLCIRIKEHLDIKRKSCDSTALGGHRSPHIRYLAVAGQSADPKALKKAIVPKR